MWEIDCGVKNWPCIVKDEFAPPPCLGGRGLHYYIVARAANISKNLQFILVKIKSWRCAYTHAQRIQLLRHKIVKAQDPSKYLLYRHILYIQWLDLTSEINIEMCVLYSKSTCWAQCSLSSLACLQLEKLVQAVTWPKMTRMAWLWGAVLTITHTGNIQEPGTD